MKTLRQVILEHDIEWSYIHIHNSFNYMNEINLCLCYLQYFLIKIATIKNKSNVSYLNTN